MLRCGMSQKHLTSTESCIPLSAAATGGMSQKHLTSTESCIPLSAACYVVACLKSILHQQRAAESCIPVLLWWQVSKASYINRKLQKAAFQCYGGGMSQKHLTSTESCILLSPVCYWWHVSKESYVNRKLHSSATWWHVSKASYINRKLHFTLSSVLRGGMSQKH